MSKLPQHTLSFVNYLQQGLQNFCGPTFSRLAVLQDLALHLIGDPFASHFRTAHRSHSTSISKTVTRTLEAFHHLPDVLKSHRSGQFRTSLDHRRPVIIAVDDTLVPKRGKKIYAVKKCFDHGEARYVQAQTLVDALVKQGDTILGVSYRIVAPKPPEARGSSPSRPGGNPTPSSKDPDLHTKQELALDILNELVAELVQAGQPRNKIWVETDAWYPSEQVLRTIRQLGVKFMLALKKNSRVQLPDKRRMIRQKTQKRGRPIKVLTWELRIDQYFQRYRRAHYFTENATGSRIWYKSATVNLKSYGRSTVYAFHPTGADGWRYFLTPVGTTGAPRAWARYRHRWAIETMHLDLKQYFGLAKCKCRREKVVKGHVELVYGVFSLYRTYRAVEERGGRGPFTARRAYDQVVAHVERAPPWEWVVGETPGQEMAMI
jgi:SRSO17 transposase